MSKIFISGDWHGYRQWALTMIEVAFAEGIDKIIQLGDFGIWPGKEGEEYLIALSRALVKQKIKLYFVPGNHEDYNQIDNWTKTLPKNKDGHIEVMPNLFYAGKVNSWVWEGKVFASVGGAVSIDRKWRKINESWWPQEELTDEEEASAISIGKVDYLFTHDCPTTHPFRNLSNHLQSEIHRARMTRIAKSLKAELWFHGHMHRADIYPFEHSPDEYSTVYALDADGNASYGMLSGHTAVLDVATGQVSRLYKTFDWFNQKFYFKE